MSESKQGCLRCGKCCRNLRFKMHVPMRREQEFYRARGFKVVGESVDVVVDHVCPQLTEDNRCRLQKCKPFLCRKYPEYVLETELNEGCGYRL